MRNSDKVQDSKKNEENLRTRTIYSYPVALRRVWALGSVSQIESLCRGVANQERFRPN